MKNQLILIICFLTFAISGYSQTEETFDYLKVTTESRLDGETYVRDTTITDLINFYTSGSSTSGSNGIVRVGDIFKLGAPLIETTTIEGGINDIFLGTGGSKINAFNVNSQSFTVNSDGSITLTSNGTSCIWDGTDLICGGVEMANFNDVATISGGLIPKLPFNYNYIYSTIITDARPGAGLFRLNNALYGSVTQIFIDYIDNDGTTQNNYLARLDTGSYITIYESTTNNAIYQLTGARVDAGNYFKYAVTYKGSIGTAATLSTTEAITVDLEPNNNTGSGGGVVADTTAGSYAGDTLIVGIDARHLLYNDGGILTIIDSSGTAFLNLSDGITESLVSKDGFNGRFSSSESAKNSIMGITYDGDIVQYRALNSGVKPYLWLRVSESGAGESELRVYHDSIVDTNMVANFKKYEGEKITIDTLNLNGANLTDTISLKAAIETETFDSIRIKGYTIRFNESEGVHEFVTAKAGVVWQGPLESLFIMYNNTGATLTNGKLVSYSGSIGDSINTVVLANNYDSTALNIAGMVTADIANNDWGFGTKHGFVRDLASLGITNNVYLSTNGDYMNSKPGADTNVVIIGDVVKSHATDGIINVDINTSALRQPIRDNKSFTSQGIGTGDFYKYGFYDFSTTDANLTQAATTVTYGTANIAYDSHPVIITGGAGSATGGVVGVRITGTSVDDDGTVTPGDADTILTDITTAALNNMYEAKKFRGTFTVELITISGTPTTYNLDFNYGYAGYEDFDNRNFYVKSFLAQWQGGATDATGFDVTLLHHKPTGWTYAATGFVPGNGAIIQRSVDQASFLGVLSGIDGRWKRSNLSTYVLGASDEGVIVKWSVGANNAIQTGDFTMEVEIDK